MPARQPCPICRDIGWLAYDVELSDPRFSQIVPCPRCNQPAQQKRLQSICGLNDEDLQKTLATTNRTPDNAKAFDGAKAVIEKPSWFYTLHGKNGRGKTHLLAMIVNECRMRGWPSIYTVTAEVMDYLRETYAPGAPASTDARWEQLVTAKVLVLDEIDKFNPTQWAVEKFFELTNLRYRNGATCLTAFALNAEIESVDESLRSRMEDRRCRIYEVTGPDLRRIRK